MTTKTARQSPATPDILKKFIITFWCAPPAEETNLRRYREIAECGFNLVLTWFNDLEMNRKVLDLCQQTGLQALIGDFRLLTPPDAPVFAEYIDQLIGDHAGHPAMAGYYLRDEPHACLFPFLGAVNQHLRKNDPTRLPYLNLFPNHAGKRLWGTKTYEEHVQSFIQVVRPALVSWDHYATLKQGEGKEYFTNLELVRRLCLKARLPFMQVILATPSGQYRDPSETDLWWQVYTTLAYGARGISYFTYWTPAIWKNGIISPDGKRTSHYEMVKRLNARVNVLGPTLVRVFWTDDRRHTVPGPRLAGQVFG